MECDTRPRRALTQLNPASPSGDIDLAVDELLRDRVPMGAPAANREVHGLFTDGMVLQQGVKCPIWGTAAPAEQVTVSLNTDDAKTAGGPSVEADRAGLWSAQLGPLQPGGPYTLTIKGNNFATPLTAI